MFIDTMSCTELMREYSNDLPEIKERAHAFTDSDYVTKYLHKRRKMDFVTMTKQIKVKSGNKYIGTMIYMREGAGKNIYWNWMAIHVGLMNTHKGLMVLAFFEKEQLAVKYSPHFFRRYKERMLNNDNCNWKLKNQLTSAKTQEQIISLYIQRNLGTSWIQTESVYKEKTHIFAPVTDGVTLMQWDSLHKTLQANTFITYDMLDEKQSKMIEDLNKYNDLNEEEQQRLKNPLFTLNNDK